MQLIRLDDIEKTYESVYISPHFDDAAASCGGRIADQTRNGRHVLVVTVFSGLSGRKASRSARRFTAEYPRRRLEDHAAMGTLGTDFLWLNYPDIVFRSGHPLFRYRPIYRPAPADKTKLPLIVSDLIGICKKTFVKKPPAGNCCFPWESGSTWIIRSFFRPVWNFSTEGNRLLT
ncbi:MAG: PIG-L family deacetylase [Deltaproteobacteria bacterium]